MAVIYPVGAWVKAVYIQLGIVVILFATFTAVKLVIIKKKVVLIQDDEDILDIMDQVFFVEPVCYGGCPEYY